MGNCVTWLPPQDLHLQVAKAAWSALRETHRALESVGEGVLSLLSSGMKLRVCGRNRRWRERRVGCYSWGSNIRAEDTPYKEGCVCGTPGELCASSTSWPGVMPPSLSYPPSQTVGTSAQFPASNPLCFAHLFSLLGQCFGAEVISEHKQVLVAAGGSRHRWWTSVACLPCEYWSWSSELFWSIVKSRQLPLCLEN